MPVEITDGGGSAASRTDRAEHAALMVAGAVIVALTGAAFWLSYAHLADVALSHGLATAPERAWAWPATLDLFIVAGEVLMFRAALRSRVDWWAVALTVAGSVGSIGLNVAGVDGGDGITLEHVVAAVPPTAALLAFAALMRQVQGLVTRLDAAPAPGVDTVPVPVDTAPAAVPSPAAPEVTPGDTEASPAVSEVSPVPDVVDTAPVAPGLPRCADGTLLPVPEVPERPRLSTEDAAAVIEHCWEAGRSIRQTAALATRSSAFVGRKFQELDDAADRARAEQVPGQLAIVGGAA
jgi:hypothetical protein